MKRRFQQIDVFGSLPYGGNPLAVVLDAEGLDDSAMSEFSRWTNLSETTFVLPPTTDDADYRVRIFTLERELPFAGHPTLGTCHAWLAAGGQPRDENTVIQECGAGLVPVRRDANRLAFAAPALVRSGPVDAETRHRVATALRLSDDDIVDIAWVDNGPGWVGVLLADAAAVLAVEPDPVAFGLGEHLDIGLVGPYPAGSETAVEVRALLTGASHDLIEDPVTGSLNASLAQWLISTGRLSAPYVAAQGTRLRRSGRAYVDQDADGGVWVGGATATVIEGQVDV